MRSVNDLIKNYNSSMKMEEIKKFIITGDKKITGYIKTPEGEKNIYLGSNELLINIIESAKKANQKISLLAKVAKTNNGNHIGTVHFVEETK